MADKIPRLRALVAAVLIFVAGTVVTERAAPARAANPAVAQAVVSPVAGCPRTIWHDSDLPAVAAVASATAIELGVKFRVDRDGYVTGIRFYKGSGNTGTHIGRLWSWNGEKLAEATFTGESASGWQQVSFSAPVRVSAGATFVAAYYAPAGHYAYTYDYFASAGRVRAPLTALKEGADGSNGVFHTGAGFPTSSYRSTNYWVDPIFDSPAGEGCQSSIWTDTQVPGTPNAGGAAAVELGVKFRASQNGFIQGVRFFKGTGDTGTHIGRLWTATGQKLAQATFSAESPTGWQNVWFAQPVGITAGTTYVASYFSPIGHYTAGVNGLTGAVTNGPLTALPDGMDGGNGVYIYGSGGGFPNASYHATNYGVDVLFTTTAAVTCTCTIWPPTTEPRNEASTDKNATEVGLRFAAQRNGFIKGVRFYKSGGNTGTHVGHLWSTGGALLAQATFTNETASGWQQVLFSSPVAVTAGTVYVASYYAPAGRYAFDDFYFAVENAARGPLTAPAGANNGVYRYGTGFPSSTFNSSNYWVDVVYDFDAADTTPPVVVAQTPYATASAVSVGATVQATFSEAVTGASISVAVQGGGGSLAGSSSYDAAKRTLRFTPSAPLAYLTDYAVTVSGARDSAGNIMAPMTSTFTTAFDPNSGPGGPIGVITSNANPYSNYYAEILRAEGLNEFTMLSLNNVTASALGAFDVVILADVTPTADQVALLTGWVGGGGRLIAMSPDASLAPLLGLTPAGGTLTNGYLAVDNATPAGAGITAATMQFHGTADKYSLSGATMVAKLYADATTATANPAVSTRDVGSSGGKAAAFSFDLARSVALTRQGNPAWAGQERDGKPPIRSDDLFFGGTSPDWVDLNKVAIPQADEQQRLLANLIETYAMDRRPLPRFWYLPRGANAVVVPTGDDEVPNTSGSSGRFDRYIANSTPGCNPADWQCLRFTSYLWSSVALTNAQARAYTEMGFEVSLHTQNGCTDFDPASLEQTYADQLAVWAAKFQSIAPPETGRYHCIVYSDWDSQPKTELRHGMRLDANYYFWPATWIQDRPGFMTGSGMPMRFTDIDGRIIDVYQAATSMTDESGQSYPFTADTLLNRALGPEGYYGVFVANMHNANKPTSYQDDQLVASSQNHGVPVTTAREILYWLDGRGASAFQNLAWSDNALSFSVQANRAARGLRAMLPTTGVGGTTLTALTRNGSTVTFDRATVKGIEYALFPADSGAYVATYATGTAAVTAAVATTLAAPDAATVSWTSSLPGTAEIAYGTSPTALNQTTIAEKTRKHQVRLNRLTPGTTYYYRVSTTDARGNRKAWPSATTVASFTTPGRDTAPPVISGLAITPLPDSTVRVTWRTNEPSLSRVDFGTTPDKLDGTGLDETLVTSHTVVLANLDANRQYYLRVQSADGAGNSATLPAAAATGFVTSPPGVADQTRVGFRTGTPTGTLVVQGDGLADLTLSTAEQSKGAFVSRVFDAEQTVPWRTTAWQADVPSGARLTVSVRSGDSATPDSTWSDWTTVAGPGSLDVPAGRYLQYRIEMTAGKSAAPVLHWIGFTY